MSTIYLVRHTQYDNPRHILPGRLPVELSATGREEAARLKDFFADKNVTTIYSSGVKRCVQTATVISNERIPVQHDQRLLETFSAYQGFWIEDWQHFFDHQKEVGGENFTDIQNRMIEFWHEVALRAMGDIIVCSHGDPLYFLYLYLLDQPLPPLGSLSTTWVGYPDKGSILPIIIESNKPPQLQQLITQTALTKT